MDIPSGSYAVTFSVLGPGKYLGVSDSGNIVVLKLEPGTPPPLWEVQKLEDNSYQVKISGKPIAANGSQLCAVGRNDNDRYTFTPIKRKSPKGFDAKIHPASDPNKSWRIDEPDPGAAVSVGPTIDEHDSGAKYYDASRDGGGEPLLQDGGFHVAVKCCACVPSNCTLWIPSSEL